MCTKKGGEKLAHTLQGDHRKPQDRAESSSADAPNVRGSFEGVVDMKSIELSLGQLYFASFGNLTKPISMEDGGGT